MPHSETGQSTYKRGGGDGERIGGSQTRGRVEIEKERWNEALYVKEDADDDNDDDDDDNDDDDNDDDDNDAVDAAAAAGGADDDG